MVLQRRRRASVLDLVGAFPRRLGEPGVPEVSGGRAGLGARRGGVTFDFPESGILAVSPPGRNFSPWRWFERQLAVAAADRVDPCPVDAPDQLAAWQRRARRRLKNLLGPLPSAVPARIEVRSSFDCGNYRRDLIVYDSEEH